MKKNIFKIELVLILVIFNLLTLNAFAQKEESGFIQNFYILGPFEGDDLESKAIDNEKELGPSDNDFSGKKWREYSFTDKRLNLHEAFGYIDNIYGYVYFEVNAPENIFVKLLVGSDDGIKIWVNGRNVFTNPAARALHIDEDKINVQLVKGVNKILIKINNYYGGYEFSTRITTQDGKEIQTLSYNPKNIYLKRLTPVKIVGSSIQGGKWDLYNPIFAIDGDLNTRWASAFYDPQFLEVDFGKSVSVKRINVIWENAYAKKYSIDISDDGNEWKSIYSEEAGRGKPTLFLPSGDVNARFIRLFCAEKSTDWGDSIWEFGIYGISVDDDSAPYQERLKTVKSEIPQPMKVEYIEASSNEPGNPEKNEYFNPEFSIDNDYGTRWSSEHSDPQWILLDLGKTRSLKELVLVWDAAYAKGYKVEISIDKKNWTMIDYTNEGKGQREVIKPEKPLEVRYIRLYCDVRATAWGYSLWEIQPFGE